MKTINWSALGDVLAHNTLAHILIIIICLIVAHWVIGLLAGRLIRGLVRDKKYHSVRAAKQREDTLIMVFSRATAIGLWVIGVGLVLSQLDFNWAGLAAGAGVLGIVIGFGAQKVAGDFIAGFFILLENQYGIGDVVEVANMAYGVVERIDLRTTHIRNLDGGLHVIANGEIVNMANHSFGFATAVLYFWFANDTNVDEVETIMNQVGATLTKDETWGKEIKTALAFDRVEDFGADGLKVRVLGNTEPGMQWAVAGEFRRRLKPVLETKGIELAYPHRVVHRS